MYVFAIMMVFGLGVTATVRFMDRMFSRAGVREVWPLMAVAVGIGLAWLADFDVWHLWGVHVRSAWIGIALTGVALGGVAYFFHEILGFLSGLHRKVEDEAAVMEMEHVGIRKVA